MRNRYIFRLSALLAAAFLYLSGCESPQEITNRQHSVGVFAMGTYMNLTAFGEQAEAALNDAKNRITEFEALWSTIDENSEIYMANHSHGEAVALSPETEELLRFALKMAEQTGGALDPTIYPLVDAWGFIRQEYRVPSEQEISELLSFSGYEEVMVENHAVTLPKGTQLDLGAVGKGYTGELLAEDLKEQGITSALLDIGGNIQMVGGRPDGKKMAAWYSKSLGRRELWNFRGGGFCRCNIRWIRTLFYG